MSMSQDIDFEMLEHGRHPMEDVDVRSRICQESAEQEVEVEENFAEVEAEARAEAGRLILLRRGVLMKVEGQIETLKIITSCLEAGLCRFKVLKFEFGSASDLYCKLDEEGAAVSESEWKSEFGDIIFRHLQTLKIASWFDELKTGTTAGVANENGPSSQHESDLGIVDDVDEAPPAVPELRHGGPDSPGYNASQYEIMLDLAKNSKHVLPLPWESGFVQAVLGPSPLQLFPRPVYVPTPSLPEEEKIDEPAIQPASKLERKGTPARASQRKWKDKLRDDQVRAMQSWVPIVMAAGTSFRAGKMVHEAVSDDERLDIVELLVGHKSSGTLRSRAFSILRYAKLMYEMEDEPFPITEDKVSVYVRAEVKASAPATRLRRFKQALLFVKHTLGIPVTNEALESSFLQGGVQQTMKRKRKTRKRLRMTVRMLSLFERGTRPKQVPAGESPLRALNKRVFAGHVAFLTHCRGRFGDHQYIEKEPEIQGSFISAESSWHKTAHQRHRDACLPFLGAALGVDPERTPWAKHWLDARKEAGLEAFTGKPFLPCPRPDGTWGEDSMTSDEAGRWMRKFLSEEGVEGDLSELGVHSCKLTFLGWASKFGIDRPTRKVLGGHLGKEDVVAVGYAQDELVEPVRKLMRLIKSVRNGEFRPDLPRNSYFKKGFSGVNDDEEDENESEDSGEPGTSEDSESDSSSSSPTEPDEEVPQEAINDVAIDARRKCRTSRREVEGLRFYKHVKFGTVHVEMPLPSSREDVNDGIPPLRFACGRRFSARFQRVESNTESHCCFTCFGPPEAADQGIGARQLELYS